MVREKAYEIRYVPADGGAHRDLGRASTQGEAVRKLEATAALLADEGAVGDVQVVDVSSRMLDEQIVDRRRVGPPR